MHVADNGLILLAAGLAGFGVGVLIVGFVLMWRRRRAASAAARQLATKTGHLVVVFEVRTVIRVSRIVTVPTVVSTLFVLAKLATAAGLLPPMLTEVVNLLTAHNVARQETRGFQDAGVVERVYIWNGVRGSAFF